MTSRFRLSWIAITLGALAIFSGILAWEGRTSMLAVQVGRDWAARERLPCPGLTGALTAMPLFTAMGERLSRAPAESVALIGDSTFTSSPGCGHGELPADLTFGARLKAELGGAKDVANFGLWSADWPVLSRQTALLRLVQQSVPAPRVWVVLTNFPQPVGHLHPVLFAQLCHHPTCDLVCRQLCIEEAQSRSGGLWNFFQYFPAIANASAGVASFVQTFVTAAPLTSRPVAAADDLGWRTLASEREVTALYEHELVAYRDPVRAVKWKREGIEEFHKAIELLKAGWTEGGLLQLWYKEWMRQLRGLDGRVVFVSQVLDPEYLATASSEDRKLLDGIRDWMDREALSAVPGATLARLELSSEDYYDMVHWTASGAASAARQVAATLRRAAPAQGGK